MKGRRVRPPYPIIEPSDLGSNLRALQKITTHGEELNPLTSPLRFMTRELNKAKLSIHLPGVVRPGYNYYVHVGDWRTGAQFTPEVKQAQYASIAKQGLMYQEYPHGNIRPFMSGPWQTSSPHQPVGHNVTGGAPATGLEVGPTSTYHRGSTNRSFIIEVPEGVKHLREIGKELTEAEIKANVARHEAMYPNARLARAQGYTHRLPPKYIVGHIEEGRFTPFPETAARVGKTALQSPAFKAAIGKAAKGMTASIAGGLFYELLPPIGGSPLGTSLQSATMRTAGEGSDYAEERQAARQETASEKEYWRTHTPDVQQMTFPEQLRHEKFKEEEAPKKEPTLYEQAFPLTAQAGPEFEFPIHPTGQQRQEDRLSVAEEAVRMDELKKRERGNNAR